MQEECQKKILITVTCQKAKSDCMILPTFFSLNAVHTEKAFCVVCVAIMYIYAHL
jgi:hypothetical protein